MGFLIAIALLLVALTCQSCTGGLGGFEDVPFTITVTNNTSRIVVDHEFFRIKPETVNGGGAVVFKPGTFLQRVRVS